MTIACPRCSSTDVRRSRRRVVEHVLSLLGFYPYRCWGCMRRFVANGRR